MPPLQYDRIILSVELVKNDMEKKIKEDDDYSWGIMKMSRLIC